MNAQAVYFDSHSGHSLVVYSCGVFCWSYAIDGVPGGKSFLTRKRACKAARQAAYTLWRSSRR